MRWQVKNAVDDAFDALDALERQAASIARTLDRRTKGCADVHHGLERCNGNIACLRNAFGLLEAELVAAQKQTTKRRQKNAKAHE